jgi:cytochrome P450
VHDRTARFRLGAATTSERLEAQLHETLSELRAGEPVSWVPALDAWVVTSRELAVEVMRDAAAFTVDDPRFSTAQVLGPSMLSLEGAEHGRHREPFADAFRLPEVRRKFTEAVVGLAREIVADIRPAGRAEVRRELAGPLAARVMALALDLVDVDAPTLLAWYRQIVGAVSAIATGEAEADRARSSVDALAAGVARTIDAGQGVLADAHAALTAGEIVSNTGVLLFGGIETTEGMTTNLFAHLLAEPGLWEAVAADRSLIPNAVEESLRLEPSVVRVDRFATRPTRLGGADIERGEFVIVMIAAANRDPATFADPDRFDVRRANARQHLTFAQGPHTCLGMHLARLEASAAIDAALELLPGLRYDPEAPSPVASGTVFRKPDRLDVVWDRRPATRS